MIEATALTPQDIQNYLINNLRSEDQQVQVFVKRTSLGWLRIRIIANSFEGKTLVEREDIIDRLLTSFNSDLNLGQYPIAGYDLLTPQEASEGSISLLQKYQTTRRPLR